MPAPRASSCSSAAAGLVRSGATAGGWRSRRRRCCAPGGVAEDRGAASRGAAASTESTFVAAAVDRQRPGLGRACCSRTPTPCSRCARTARRSTASRSASSARTPTGADAQVEVRAFVPGMGIGEDPVTGSLNAGIGQWLAGDRLPARYVASQGTALGRRGRVHVDLEGDACGSAARRATTVRGEVDLRAASGGSLGGVQAVPRPPPADPRRGRREGRPHRHRHAQRLRPPDALRPRRGLPAGDHQEGAHPLGRSPSCCGSCAATPTSSGCRTAASRSGTSGPTRTATSARSTATSGAPGRRPTAGTSTRSPRSSSRSGPTPTRGATSSRAWNVADIPQMALAPVPRAVPVLRRARRPAAQLPALPALGRRLPRRAVQHRLLRAADPHGRPGHRPRGRRLRAHARRRAPLPQPPRPGPAPADPRAPAAADAAARPVGDRDRRVRPRAHQPSRATTRTPASRRPSPYERRRPTARRRWSPRSPTTA